jgi:hypothetical protein
MGKTGNREIRNSHARINENTGDSGHSRDGELRQGC